MNKEQAGKVAGYIDRVANLNADIAALNDDKRKILKDARDAGFDKTAISTNARQLAEDFETRIKREATDSKTELYREAYRLAHESDDASRVRAPAPAPARARGDTAARPGNRRNP